MANAAKTTVTKDRSGVRAAYGEPVEVDGATILPVAITSYGFGGRRGSTGQSAEEAEANAQLEGAEPHNDAAAGGGFSWPIGAYVTRDGYTRFEANLISVLLVGIPFVCVAGRALRKIIRALKK